MAADTEEKALELVKPVEVWAINSMLYGKNENFPSNEEAKNHTFSFQAKMMIDFKRRSAFVGDTNTVCEKLIDNKKKLAVHEFTLVTITDNFEDKLNSYKLISDYFSKH